LQPCARAEAVGGCVIFGCCFERDRAVPYAPFVDALRAFVGSLQPAQAVELIGVDLAALLPELGVESQPESDPKQKHERVIEGLVRLLSGLASRHNLLLLIEDLHWADSISLEVFGTLARRLRAQPVLLVGTLRDEQVDSGLESLLAESILCGRSHPLCLRVAVAAYRERRGPATDSAAQHAREAKCGVGGGQWPAIRVPAPPAGRRCGGVNTDRIRQGVNQRAACGRRIQ
jgi:hypothetical protein